jgi:proteasome lid subunit RPN8/RPN11
MLWLTQEHVNTLVQAARHGAPHEVCGLIVGISNRATQIIPIPNVAADPITRYEMDAKAQFEAVRDAEQTGLAIIAFYHSHPKGDPIPSETDIREAFYGDTPYLIIGLKSSEPQLAAWSIQNMRVTPVPLHIGFTRPEANLDENPLSRAQVVAIFASAIIALVILLIVSINLLPPAPPIP